MSDAQALYAEKVTDTTAATTTWVDVCSLAAASFTANKKYLILANVFLTSTGSASEVRARLVHGTTPTEFDDAALAIETANTNQQGICASWLTVFTQPGTTELVKLQIANSSTDTTTAQLGQIFALNLDDVGVQNTDWFYTEDLVDYTTTASKVSKASVTFTPNGTDDWLISGSFAEVPGSVTANYLADLNDSVAGVLTSLDIEGEDVTNELRGHVLMVVVTPTNASHTFSLRFSHETTAGTVRSNRIFAINLNKFAQHVASFNAAAEAPAATPSWTTTRTLSPTATATGNWFIWGHFTDDVGTLTDSLGTRLQINPGGGGLASNPNYGDDMPKNDNSWDATDDIPIHLFTLLSLTSGAARDINLDVQMISGTTLRVKNRQVVAFSVALAVSGVTVAPAPAAAIGRVVAPAVVLGSLSIAPAARAVVGRVVAPTVVLGSLALAPTASAAIGRTVDPTVVITTPPITPAPATAVGRVVAPGVVLGSILIANAVAAAIGRVVAPAVVLGSLAVTPGPASAVARSVAPTVVISGGGGPSPVRRRLRWIYFHWRRFSRWV